MVVLLVQKSLWLLFFLFVTPRTKEWWLIFACLPARERREKHAYSEQSSRGLSTFQRAAHFPLPPRTQNNPTSADCPNAKKLAPFKFKELLRKPSVKIKTRVGVENENLIQERDARAGALWPLHKRCIISAFRMEKIKVKYRESEPLSFASARGWRKLETTFSSCQIFSMTLKIIRDFFVLSPRACQMVLAAREVMLKSGRDSKICLFLEIPHKNPW